MPVRPDFKPRQLDSRPVLEPDGETLRNFDEMRGAQDEVLDKVQKAVEEQEAIEAAVADKRRAALEKARAAKAAKRAAAAE
jgi:hypothetical protein